MRYVNLLEMRLSSVAEQAHTVLYGESQLRTILGVVEKDNKNSVGNEDPR